MTRDHMQVLKTLYDNGNITRQQMKSIRGQIIRMNSNEERERYLKNIIKKSTTTANVGVM